MASAVRAHFIIKGVCTSVTILCDIVEIEVVEEMHCNGHLVENGHFEDSKDLICWTGVGGASIELFDSSVFWSAKALSIISSSLSLGHEPSIMHALPVSCFIEGKEYYFKVFNHLYDVDREEFVCEKSAKHGDPKICLVVGIHCKADGIRI